MMRNLCLLITLTALTAGNIEVSNGTDCSTNENEPTPRIYYTGKSQSGFYSLALTLLNGLRNGIPYEWLKSTIKDIQESPHDFDFSKIKELTSFVFKNQTGFIIFFVVGVLFVVFLPLIGISFLCCRCCNKCGGKPVQNNPSTLCFGILIALFVLCFVMMVVGVHCYVISSHQLYDNLTPALSATKEQTRSLSKFVQEVPEELVCNIRSVVDTLKDTVDSGATNLGNMLVSSMKKTFVPLRNVTEQLNQLNDTLNRLNAASTSIKQLAEDLKTSLPSTIPRPLLAPAHTELDVYINGSKILSDYVESITSKLDISKIDQEVNVDIKVDELKSHIANRVKAAKTKINNSQGKINQAVDQIKNMSSQADKFIDEARDSIDEFAGKTVHKIQEDYGWARYVLPILLLPIFVALGCALGGFASGVFGYKRDRDPTERSMTSHNGSHWLMASAVVMIIFGSFCMMLTIVLFTVGYTLQFACHPVFQDPTMEVYGKINDFYNLSFEFNLGNNSVTYVADVKGIMEGCKKNQAIYEAFKLGGILDPYLKSTTDQLNNLTEVIKLDDINILIAQKLTQVKLTLNSSYNQSFRTIEKIKNELNDSVAEALTKPLNYTIEAVNSINQTQNTTKEELNKKLAKIRVVQLDFKKEWKQLKSNINDVQGSLELIRLVEENIDIAISEAQSQVANLTGTFIDNIKSKLGSIITTFKTEIGKCEDLYNVWQNFGTISCQILGYPFQGLWLGLGWCLFFVIPAIIVNVKLAKYFRRMKTPKNIQQVKPIDAYRNTSETTAYSTSVPASPIYTTPNTMPMQEINPQGQKGLRRMYSEYRE